MINKNSMTAASSTTAKQKLAAFLASNPDVSADFTSISSDIAKDNLQPAIQGIWDAWLAPDGIQSCLDTIAGAGDAGKGFIPPWRSPRLDYEINKHKLLSDNEIVAEIIKTHPNHAKLVDGNVNEKAIKKFLADNYNHDAANGYTLKETTSTTKKETTKTVNNN